MSVMAMLRQQPHIYRIADNPGVGPSMISKAFLVTYLVKLPTSRLLARNNVRVARDSGTIASGTPPHPTCVRSQSAKAHKDMIGREVGLLVGCSRTQGF
jgi:hypothetical protein